MQVTIYDKKNFKQSNWSGGTTTELYIYPPGADYAKRNFNLRISTAVVNLKESEFTPLQGINRLLMLLDGSIIIKHEGHYSKIMHPLEIDSFSGDWKTTSIGHCTDFNVMTKGNPDVDLFSVIIKENTPTKIITKQIFKILYLYVAKGNAVLVTDDATYNLNTNEFIILSEIDTPFITLQAKVATILIGVWSNV